MKLLEDYHSGRYTVFGRTNIEGEISTDIKGVLWEKCYKRK